MRLLSNIDRYFKLGRSRSSSEEEVTLDRESKYGILEDKNKRCGSPIINFIRSKQKAMLVASTFSSIAELTFMAISISSIDMLYEDFEAKHDVYYEDFFKWLFSFALGSKLINMISSHFIAKQATEQSTILAEEIARIHFSRNPQRKEGTAQLAGKLIFDSFDIIRPSLVIFYDKVIYKFLEIIIYGTTLSVKKECALEDVSIIGGSSLGLIMLGYIIVKNNVGKARLQYLEKYENLYEYIATTVGNYETVQVFGAEKKIIQDISKKLSNFSAKIDRDTDGYGIKVGIVDLFLFGGATLLAMFLSSEKNYQGDAFLYLFGYSILQARNVKELYEAFLKIAQANYSFDEIEKYKKQAIKYERKISLDPASLIGGKKEDFIKFEKVSFEHSQGKIEGLNFSIERGDKIFIKGTSGCGKSLLLKLLSGLLQPNKESQEEKTKKNIIKICGYNQEDISNLSDLVTYIHEKTEIFPGSLSDNIKIADCKTFEEKEKINKIRKNEMRQVIKDQVITSADNAVMIDKITDENINQELKKPIARIETYSSGMKKRVGLARCFFKKTPILLLDEPLANLDDQTGETFLKNLENQMFSKDRTVFIIEHGQNFKTYFKIGNEEQKEQKNIFNKIIEFRKDGEIILMEPVQKIEIPIGQWKRKAKDKDDISLSVYLPKGYKRIDVPNDSKSLFWSVTLAMLLPTVNDDKNFEINYNALFGTRSFWIKTQKSVIEPKDERENFREKLRSYNTNRTFAILNDAKLDTLVNLVLRERVAEYMSLKLEMVEKERIAKAANFNTWDEYSENLNNPDTWVGNEEIKAISRLTVVNIQIAGNGYLHNFSSAISPVANIYLAHLNNGVPKDVGKNHYQCGFPAGNLQKEEKEFKHSSFEDNKTEDVINLSSSASVSSSSSQQIGHIQKKQSRTPITKQTFEKSLEEFQKAFDTQDKFLDLYLEKNPSDRQIAITCARDLSNHYLSLKNDLEFLKAAPQEIKEMECKDFEQALVVAAANVEKIEISYAQIRPLPTIKGTPQSVAELSQSSGVKSPIYRSTASSSTSGVTAASNNSSSSSNTITTVLTGKPFV